MAASRPGIGLADGWRGGSALDLTVRVDIAPDGRVEAVARAVAAWLRLRGDGIAPPGPDAGAADEVPQGCALWPMPAPADDTETVR